MKRKRVTRFTRREIEFIRDLAKSVGDKFGDEVKIVYVSKGSTVRATAKKKK